MADWDSSNPLDNSIVSQFPANERAQRAAQSTNFGVDHHETNDANVGKHEVVSLLKQSDPSAVTDEGKLYSKDVSGVPELHYRDESGNITQLTTLGRVIGQVKPQVVTGATNAVAGAHYLANTGGGGFAITLPASPSVGDEPIMVTQVAGSASTVTIGRNGNSIMGSATDLVLDVATASIVLIWAGASLGGWRLGIIG